MNTPDEVIPAWLQLARSDLQLGHFFGVSPQFWLGLQAEYDLDVVMNHLGDRPEREVRPRPMVSI